MSESTTPSDQASSAAVTWSLGVSNPTRPTFIKDQGYTHVFPAPKADNKPSKSANGPYTRKVEQSSAMPTSLGQDDNTRRLFNGLQWLLDASTQPQESNQLRNTREPPARLSEKAVTSLNASKSGEHNDCSEAAKTAAWVDGQIKSPAAPPF